MKYPREALVGAVFIAALVILGIFTVVIGGIRNPWVERHVLRISFDDVEGLKKGDEVRVQGTQIGKVYDVSPPDDEWRIVVTCDLTQKPDIHEGYRIQVRSVSPLGGRFVSIYPGTFDAKKVDSEQVLTGQSVGDPLAELSMLIKEVRQVVAKIDQAEGLLGQLIAESDVTSNIGDIVESIRVMTKDVEAGKGTFGKLLRDEELGEKITAMVDSIESVASGIKEGKGTLGKLATDEALYVDARSAVADMKDITQSIKAGKGTLGKLYSDETLYENASDALSGFGDLGRNISEGKGLLGHLVHDEELYAELRVALTTIGDALSSFSKGEGTIGMLFKDKALYEKADQLLTNLNQVVEDAREQAPVSLFASMLMLGL